MSLLIETVKAMDSNAIFAVLLLIVGLAILMAEVFIPSGGLLGVITFLSLVVSLIFAYRAWGGSHPAIFYAFCVLLLLLIPIVIGTGFSILPHTAVGKKVILEAPDTETLTPYLAESRHLEQLVGEFGTALTMLNPGGLVRVLGERLHATSAGFAIESGDSVKVIEVRGNSIVVRPEMPEMKPADRAESPDDGPAIFELNPLVMRDEQSVPTFPDPGELEPVDFEYLAGGGQSGPAGHDQSQPAGADQSYPAELP